MVNVRLEDGTVFWFQEDEGNTESRRILMRGAVEERKPGVQNSSNSAVRIVQYLGKR